jgi:phenylalanyl-tRNA synthetase beta chain
MKVSLNWLRQFTDIDLSVDELVEKIGTQLGAVEEVVDLGKKYQGVVIAKVVGCEKHPNADKLSVCAVDDGGITPDVNRDENGYVQVVCGAPNVRAGLLVVWLPPGVTVPSTVDKDPFVLEARELRGEVSNGMLASAHELAIGDDHNGIVEVEIDVAPGTSFAGAYRLDDYILDIENKMFTHRPDCFGLLGVAREVAGIQHKQFTSPDWYIQALDRIKPGKTKLPLSVQNNAQDVVPRFMAITMAEVTVGPSPFMLQTYLSRVGLRPINNIVDITNYLMVLTGQPLHAYDADKLQKYGNLSLEARMSREGDKLNLLNGKEIVLKDNTTILITSNDVPVGIGGVMGGADTEVDETTKNIVIECANFDMYSVRRASMKYGLFTDAVTRFNKGQSKLQNERVLEEAVALVQSLASAHVSSDVADVHGELKPLEPVTAATTFINSRLGIALTAGEMAELLTNVEFTVDEHGDDLVITPPFWRTDIEIAEDVVEEVGRLYGLDKLPVSLPMRDLLPITPDAKLDGKKVLRDVLSRAGANEVLTYSFVHENLLTRSGQDVSNAFKIGNALSPDLQYYRMSLTPSLLEKVHPNIKSGFSEFALFEIGKVHGKSEIDEDALPHEFGRLGLVFSMDNKTAQSRVAGAPFYNAKLYIDSIATSLNATVRYQAVESFDYKGHVMFKQLLAPFEPLRTAVVFINDKLAGVVGEYKTAIRRGFKLPDTTAGFELFLSPFTDIDHTSAYTPVSRFPKVEQDITLKVPAEVTYQTLLDFLQDSVKTPEHSNLTVRPLDIYQKPGDTEHKQISFRCTVVSYDHTLTAAHVNELLDHAAAQAKETLQAERV